MIEMKKYYPRIKQIKQILQMSKAGFFNLRDWCSLWIDLLLRLVENTTERTLPIV